MSSYNRRMSLAIVLGVQTRRVAVVGAALLIASGCGFHLRGVGGGATLPPTVQTLRVVPPGTAENDPLTVAVREALVHAGAKLVVAKDTPALVLLGEQSESRVAAVSTATAKASEYLLLYSASFRLDGTPSLAPQTIRLQRSYSFNPAQVLAREQQEQDLLSDMRRDAAQQIVRRLSRGVGSGGS